MAAKLRKLTAKARWKMAWISNQQPACFHAIWINRCLFYFLL